MKLLDIFLTLLFFSLLTFVGVLDWGWVTIAAATLIVVMVPLLFKGLITLYFIAVILVNRLRRSKRKETR